MNANEARKLSNKNGFDKELEKEIDRINKKIKWACDRGWRSTCVFTHASDTRKTMVELEAKKHFKKLGYTFRPNTDIQPCDEICW